MSLVYGRICMSADDLSLLREAVQGANTYVEIGTLWGGSLIAALQANPVLIGWAVDPMIGYYGGPEYGTMPTRQKFWINTRAAGVASRVRLVIASSFPWPLVGRRFDVGLIDGDHSEQAAREDYHSLRYCCESILFHDIDDPAVGRVVDEARADGWKVTTRGRMALCVH